MPSISMPTISMPTISMPSTSILKKNIYCHVLFLGGLNWVKRGGNYTLIYFSSIHSTGHINSLYY